MQELVFPALNFSILIALLSYFVWPTFKKSVVTRRDAIRKLVEEAQSQKLEAERKLQDFESKLRTLESEANEILARARKDGELLKNKLIEEAKLASVRMIRDAESVAGTNLNEFKNELRRQTIEKATKLAASYLKEQLSRDDQSRMIREYVEKVQ